MDLKVPELIIKKQSFIFILANIYLETNMYNIALSDDLYWYFVDIPTTLGYLFWENF